MLGTAGDELADKKDMLPAARGAALGVAGAQEPIQALEDGAVVGTLAAGKHALPP